MENKIATIKTYRFKFTEGFVVNLKEFSRIHRFDNTTDFKDSWEIWCGENKALINKECESLKEKGYEGDCAVKMYKSVRYYFKNKSPKKSAKKRRQYLGLYPELRDAIDEHIVQVTVRRELKPMHGYLNFMDDTKYTKLLKTETTRLTLHDFTKVEIMAKFKKTYKNRYFIQK